MNSLISKFCLLFLVLIGGPSHQSARIITATQEKPKHILTEGAAYLNLVAFFGKLQTVNEVNQLLGKGDTLSVKKLLFNFPLAINNSNPIRCPYYVMLGLFHKEILKDDSLSATFFLLGNFFDNQYCNEVLDTYKVPSLASLPSSKAEALIKKVASTKILLDSTLSSINYSPLIELCLVTGQECQSAYEILGGYRRIHSIKQHHIDTLMGRVEPFLPETAIQAQYPVTSKKLVIKPKRASDQYDHIPDYVPKQENLKTRKDIDRLDDYSLTVLLIKDEKRRYDENHKSFKNIFNSCMFNHKIKAKKYRLFTARTSRKDLGLQVDIEMKQDSTKNLSEVSSCLNCFVKSLRKFSSNNNIELSQTHTKIDIHYPMSYPNASTSQLHQTLSHLDISSGNVNLVNQEHLLIKLSSVDFFRKDYTQHLIQLEYLNNRLKELQ